MGIELKSIGNLKDKRFLIPSYQRGYRWTEQQVKDLLDDIQEFIESEANLYCLQPLVIKEINENKNNRYEVVIDGQQRLTTIFIILKVLDETTIYTLDYATRMNFQDFLSRIDKHYDDKTDLKERWKILIGEDETFDNIDFYHIFTTFYVVNSWFLKKNDNEKKAFKQKLLDNVKFIWYEPQDEDSIKVFRRLNMGKIPLTNAELIKAFFLNKSNFSEQPEQLRQRQMEVAMEWDQIEYILQNDEFWSFIYHGDWKISTRIELLFNLIVEKDDFGLKIEQTDDYHTFRYFYEYFNKKDRENKIASVKEGWSNVKEYFQIFQEWFNDLKIYHYVGFLVSQGENLKELVDCWKENQTKEKFINKLKDKIKKRIDKCLPLNRQYKTDGSDKTNCKPILLLHNIQTIIDQATVSQEQYGKAVFHRFPFHIFQEEKWDVEHINSAVTNDESDSKTQKEWLLNVSLVVSEKLQDEIKNFLEDEKNRENDEYQKLKKKIEEEIKAENDEWSDEEKNKIENYTLLDSSTNRSYSNAIFSAKRRFIIGKERRKRIEVEFRDGKIEVSEKTDTLSAFVPPCTRQVFLKYFSPIVGNMNYWTKEDAKNYLEDIKTTLADFLLNDNQEGSNERQ